MLHHISHLHILPQGHISAMLLPHLSYVPVESLRRSLDASSARRSLHKLSHDTCLACLGVRLDSAARAIGDLVVTFGSSSRQTELNEVGCLDVNLSSDRDLVLEVLLLDILLLLEHDLRVAWNV